MVNQAYSFFYRVVKESGGLSVSDATAGWFIQIVAATATSSLATNPMLRTLILNHTRFVKTPFISM